MPSFQYFLYLREQKKVTGGLDPVNRQGGPTQFQLPHRQCRVSRCVVVMQDTRVVGKKFGLFPSNIFTQPFQYFQIVNLVDCLSNWYKFIMNNPFNIKKKSATLFWLLIWTNWIFLVVGNWQSSMVHFAALFQGRIGRPMFHHLWWHGPKCHLACPKGLGKLWLFFAFVLRWAPLGPFLHTSSSCQDLQLRFSYLSLFTCCAMLLTVSQWFSHTVWRIFAMFSSVLLVAGHPDLSSSVILSLPSEKRFTAVFFIALSL